MTEIEKTLEELEQAVAETDEVIKSDKAYMKEGKNFCDFEVDYKMGLVLLVPVFVGLVLYFIKPKFVMKKVKGKEVVCMTSVFMYSLLSLVFAGGLLFGVKYFELL